MDSLTEEEHATETKPKWNEARYSFYDTHCVLGKKHFVYQGDFKASVHLYCLAILCFLLNVVQTNAS